MEAQLGYNTDTKTDFDRMEIEALSGLLEATRKIFTLVKVDTMELIKDLGRIKIGNDKINRHYIVVKCENCGVNKTVRAGSKNKLCRSCGSVKANTIHGMSRTRPYKIWSNILCRTTNKNHDCYEFYKDKQPPKKWLKFEGFWEDMEEGYADNLSIDRRDNDKAYSKDNCRWVTQDIQVQNVRLLSAANTTGFRGIIPTNRKDRWKSRCCHKGKVNHLGTWDSKEDAARAYDRFVIENGLEHPLNFGGDI